MTVIRPNSISGITSITAQANEINVFRSNGLIAGLNLNGVNFNTTAGISTLAALKVTGNLDVEGVLTYQDVTNVDSLGIGTFRTGINVSGGEIVVGSNIKIGNAGIITASGLDISGDIDIDGHTNLDNTSIAGIVTAQQIRYSSGSGNWNGHPRSVVLGYSGSEYAQLGMGWIPTGTNGQHTSNNTDLQSRLQLQDGLQIYGSGASVTSGQTVTWKQVADFKPSAIKLYTSGGGNSEKFRITSSGRFGVNRSSPHYTMHLSPAQGETRTDLHMTNSTTGHNATDGVQFGYQNSAGAYIWNFENTDIYFGTTNSARLYIKATTGHVEPNTDGSQNLGASNKRWANIYTTDLQLSNEGKTNDVDGTWGKYTIQEGESDLFLINNRSGKKYKFNLTEVS